MSEAPKSVRAYDSARAERYDSHSALVWDGRARQRLCLTDLLGCVAREPVTFLDLGCGTGFFTEAIFEAFPTACGIGVDGSEAMLENARARFEGSTYDITLRCALLEALDWSALGRFSLVFSGLALHHLADREKQAVLAEVFRVLDPGGAFILIDSFRPEDPTADSIVEVLSCLKIQRAVAAQRGTAPPIERIIARDRESKAAEADEEASIEAHLRWLRETGFIGVTSVFQDDRIAALVAVKPS